MKKLKNKKFKKVGRPSYIVNKPQFVKILRRVQNGEINNLQAMQILDCRKTIYYRVKKRIIGGAKI